MRQRATPVGCSRTLIGLVTGSDPSAPCAVTLPAGIPWVSTKYDFTASARRVDSLMLYSCDPIRSDPIGVARDCDDPESGALQFRREVIERPASACSQRYGVNSKLTNARAIS